MVRRQSDTQLSHPLSLQRGSAEGLAPLGGLSILRRLKLSGEEVPERALAPLGALAQLTELRLTQFNAITELACARGLKALHELQLERCNRFSDLASLRRLCALSRLELNGCNAIADVGCAHVGSLATLVELDLARSSIGLAHDAAEISDVGIGHLSALTRLTRLALSGCSLIGDEGLAHPRPLADLRD